MWVQDYNVYATCTDKKPTFLLGSLKSRLPPELFGIIHYFIVLCYSFFFFLSLLISITKLYVDKCGIIWGEHFFLYYQSNQSYQEGNLYSSYKIWMEWQCYFSWGQVLMISPRLAKCIVLGQLFQIQKHSVLPYLIKMERSEVCFMETIKIIKTYIYMVFTRPDTL